MSRRGNRRNISPMERFRSLKNERVPVTGDINVSEAAHAFTNFIVRCYRKYNGGLPSDEPEKGYWKSANAVGSSG